MDKITQRKQWIREYLEAATGLQDVLELSPQILDYRGAPDHWTIREQVVHLGESEAAAFHRHRKAIAEPGSGVLGYNEEVWTPCPGLDYAHEDVGAWVQFFGQMRRLTAGLLDRIADQDWQGYFYQHNSAGKVTLEQWVQDYRDHFTFHRRLIDRNLDLARKAGIR